MPHLSEETLNEYLDDALAPAARAAADAHLAGCASCAAQLTALRNLFAQIESLPEARLERDLAAVVVSRLPNRPRMPAAVRWALAAQALGLLVLAVLAWPLVDLAVLSLPTAQVAGLWNAGLNIWVRALDQVRIPPFSANLPSLQLDPSAALLAVTIVSACLLWLVGNGLLLVRPRVASLKRRHP